MPPSPQQPPYPNQPGSPYGQQPPQGQQPPYGQAPYGQQSPYGQQAPYGQSQPQNPGPYGGSPYPQQGPQPGGPQQPPYQGWGGMPPVVPPPPKKSRVGLILGIVGGVVVLIVGGLVALGAIGYKAATTFPDAKNKLTLPKTLLDDKYTFSKDLSGADGQAIESEANSSWNAKDVHAVVGTYALGGDATKGTLVVSGMYGRLKDADQIRRNMMKGGAESAGTTVAVPVKDFDLDVTISCEVLVQDQAGTKMTMPSCAWADGNTAATIVVVDMSVISQDPSEVDLAALAKETLQVRSEAVKPIG
ncbi:hypothetical protein OG586_25455 [Streptomyces murinus]|uniref:hypothetical protein n=1 Tax=Streptomyces murinus TaxID=33900 RepID=UPI002E820B48|nr:hypothetical protein [Streptomyces murinus]WUD11808.1 hypothetical protein OG586_25455 [Streptomyces murinus]